MYDRLDQELLCLGIFFLKKKVLSSGQNGANRHGFSEGSKERWHMLKCRKRTTEVEELAFGNMGTVVNTEYKCGACT